MYENVCAIVDRDHIVFQRTGSAQAAVRGPLAEPAHVIEVLERLRAVGAGVLDPGHGVLAVDQLVSDGWQAAGRVT